MRQNANKMPIADQGRKNVQELDSCGPSHTSILTHCSSNNNKNEK